MAVRQVNRARPSNRADCSVEIANGASDSDLINITGHVLSAIQTSSGWTTAVIGFKASIDGSTGTMYLVRNSNGDALTYNTTASSIVAVDPAPLVGLQKLQVCSMTTAGVAVNQGALRSLVLSLTPAYIN
ncbi:hypothetical protein [Pseudomonas sp. NPDC086251]|jgi:hypothetical protein|uniref:hypothetical protein n=1 Tax=Pseudomonas sp. NPDC086251 TaxID=3364431 RepID=UPI003839B3BE